MIYQKRWKNRKNRNKIKILLLCAITQILFLDFKDYAVTNDTVEIAKIRKLNPGLINSLLKNVIQNKESINKKQFNQSSIPEWFVKSLEKSQLNLKEIIANIADEPSLHLVFKKKNLHLINAAKSLTERFLKKNDCETESSFFIKDERILKINNEFSKNSFRIVLGVGSSGPTTRWGSDNFAKLINNLNEIGDFFFLILCGPNEKKIEDDILSKLKKSNYLTLSNKTIYDLVPYLCASNMYVGNDSFGSHILSQSGKKCIVFLLDSPKAYTDYSKNYFRIAPQGYKIGEITHGTNANPDLISVNEVIKNIAKLKN